MPATKRPQILVAGLGRNADATKYPVDKFEEILNDQMRKASEAGFDCEHISLNPDDISDSIDRLNQTLKGDDWDAFEMGFAVRGNPDISELFEMAVNAFVESKPGKKLIFPNTPFEISTAPLRVFPIGEKT